MRDEQILDVTDLTLRFGADKSGQGGLLAVNNVSFGLNRQETLSIVGESGSGKTTIGRCIARLYEPNAGQITFRSEGGEVDLTHMSKAELRPIRQQIQMLFQDPNASLNSRMRIGDLVAEPLNIHRIGTPAERRDRVVSLLERVGLGADTVNRYPHQLSGGQRQRVGIARALTVSPRLLICDEPVSALDVSVQAQVLNLLRDLQDEMGLSYIFVSHDLGVVDYISDRVMVLYLGTIMELATRDDLFAAPAHPYTRALLDAMPSRRDGRHRKRKVLTGEIAGPTLKRQGCVFAGRCPHATDLCQREAPVLRPWARNPATSVACHHADALDLSTEETTI
ncbi:ABC transporter ATP-binding protein [Oceanomicrobium pacificus]|uniref:ATP-binding cassette domain-containing protein n=1 Tax=Oceanomicrobium pacificus TaxID=2692916 RepID=A0A6B0TKL6_9RHOB|nr:oligopeptide/dipeptide ABC transporter ATP-binding protein [Oceanomicrobium pacificus]MXU64396.1 ATP-binding cassette domain-containing protein [Oceanomicrobium pacificus]